MNIYKGKNIVSIVSSVVSAVMGGIIILMAREYWLNIIGIAFILTAIVGFVNYMKYSIMLDGDGLKITSLFKSKKVKYKDIVKVYTITAGKTSVTYLVDKYFSDGKWYLRGTYPPLPANELKSVDFIHSSSNINAADIFSINSYVFEKYSEILTKLLKKLPVNCEINPETWKIINNKDNN